MQKLDPFTLEKFIASYYVNTGHKVKITKERGDGGFDIVNIKDKQIIEIKRKKNKIRITEIRSFLGALLQHKYTSGVFITTGEFCETVKKAVNYALKNNPSYKLTLINGSQLVDMLYQSDLDIYELAKHGQKMQRERVYPRKRKVLF